jgi:hypothetical protein
VVPRRAGGVASGSVRRDPAQRTNTRRVHGPNPGAGTEQRSPAVHWMTFAPTASTWPAIPCPGTRGYVSPGKPPSATKLSL